MDSDVCDIILDDADFSGTRFKVIKDKMTSSVKSIQSTMAKKIKEISNKYIKKTFNITYNGIRRFVLVTLIYLDLCFDSVLLIAIFSVLSTTRNFGTLG